MFFDTWQELGRIIITGILAYVALVFLLQSSGKRALSAMNAFDLIVTVAIGSMLASIILLKDVRLAEGLLALVLLIGLQFIVTWLSVRFPIVQHIVKLEPTLLFHQGLMLQSSLRSQRVTCEEVRAAIRNQGISQMSEVEAVILETNGSFSILRATTQPTTTALQDITDYPEHAS